MLSVASLLNPAPPGPPINRYFPSPASSSSSPTTSLPDESGLLDEPVMAKQKIPKSTALLPTSRPKGVINFPPHESLDEASLFQVGKFRVHSFGNIQNHSRHIPYNSGKKDFFDKTGRESFEVFQYDFKVPGDETEYTIMWDYNVGLVRMTPFFKCCKYPKTTPAKMLNLNPGLKEITHSITGGSIMAQGYWMPFRCAKAVCATFCHNIAGALIPIFGPEFPSLCPPPESPDYGRMIIDPAIVAQATREAELYRRLYSNSITSVGSSSGSRPSPPRDRRPLFRGPYDDPRQNQHHHHHHYARRHAMRKTFVTPPGCDSPYATDTDSDMSPVAPERSVMVNHRDRFPYSPMPPQPIIPSLRPTSSGWTPANVLPPHHHHHHHYDTPGPSPWLSAIPRFTTATHLPPYLSPHTQPQPWRGANKRPADYVDADFNHSHNHSNQGGGGGRTPTMNTTNSKIGGENSIPSRTTTTTAATIATTPGPEKDKPHPRSETEHHNNNNNTSNARTPKHPTITTATTPIPGPDKNAALLLMNLSVRDARGNKQQQQQQPGAVVTSETSSPRDAAFPRIKRVRANSA
ncbi:hypothetical protein M426DRAFT_9817 [Hypoxylon sp. CI-4A]|nr:hypothetical protein M426DRAFT_9817 [Hypoxylon sp. CI-4A]